MKIPILRVRDKDGNYVDIPAIRGQGDMEKSAYDSDGVVAAAGGIKAYVQRNGGGGGGDGVTFYPYVDANGNLSWTNNGGLDNPATVNIRGPQGLQGEDGKDGSDGQPGAAGSPGADGVSPVVSVSSVSGGHRITITDKNGTKTVDVMNGSTGQTGATGQPGKDGEDGKDATINGVNALTIQGGDGIDATMSGGMLTIKAKTVETWTFTLEDDSTVTKKVVLV